MQHVTTASSGTSLVNYAYSQHQLEEANRRQRVSWLAEMGLMDARRQHAVFVAERREDIHAMVQRAEYEAMVSRQQQPAPMYYWQPP